MPTMIGFYIKVSVLNSIVVKNKTDDKKYEYNNLFSTYSQPESNYIHDVSCSTTKEREKKEKEKEIK